VILYIYKTPPDELADRLEGAAEDGEELVRFRLDEPRPDYNRLVQLIFSADKVLSWY
jgi:hypothetical protein